MMQLYQNVGSARLAERAVLVLYPLSASSAKSVVNPFFLGGASVVSSVAVHHLITFQTAHVQFEIGNVQFEK